MTTQTIYDTQCFVINDHKVIIERVSNGVFVNGRFYKNFTIESYVATLQDLGDSVVKVDC